MKISFGSQIKKWFAGFALLSFFAAAVFSVGIGMDMDDMGNMAPCAFMMGQTTICPMGVSQHIDEWAGFFAPIASMFIFFVALPFLAAVFFVFFLREHERQKRKRLYFLSHFYLKVSYLLIYLFSRGILNTRAYKLATI